MPRAAGRGPPAHGAARLLQWLEPGSACGEIRRAGEYNQDLAAAEPFGDPGVPRIMTMDEDRDGFAAEYALGTLNAEERAQADALVLVDQDFAAKVREWERRLGELNVLVAPLEPPAPVWDRIRAGLDDAGQSGVLHLPEVAAPATAQN